MLRKSRWQRFIGPRFHTPPEDLAGGGSGGSPAPEPGADKIDGPLTLDRIDADNPEILKAAFKQLQAEAKGHRLKAREYREERDNLVVENKQFKDREQAELLRKAEEEKNYKEANLLRDRREAEERQVAQRVAIDAKLEAAFHKKGLHPERSMKLIERNGISIDNTGSIRGIDEAIERMERDWEDVVKPVVQAPAAKEAADASAAAQADSGNPADKMYNPLTGRTYGEHKQMVNPGKTPAGASPNTSTPKKNYRDMSKAEADAQWRLDRAKLGK